MSFTIDYDVKERVRNAIDIVDLLGGYMQLRRQGRDFVAPCPWHDDRRPSLRINPARQTWKCWVCDIGGDVFSFVQKREGIEFPEAVRMLADRAGIAIGASPQEAARSKAASDEKRQLFEAIAWACREYHECFLKSSEAHAAREYLQRRGINEQSIAQFQIGYAPAEWTWLQNRLGRLPFDVRALDATGVVGKSERGSRYDRFQGRVLFPIRDTQGRPIAIGGRILPGAADAAKYINCPETRLYTKSQQLYGLDHARDAISKSRQAIVMEGYTDVIMAHQHGIQTAVACCGTALGARHIELLKRYCDQVVLLLDGDEAGQKRANEVLELFISAQMDLRILTLPDQLDPCDFLIERGAEPLNELISQSVDALEHKFRVVCQGFDPIRDTHRATQAVKEILGTMALAPKLNAISDADQKLKQNQLLVRISRYFRLPENDLREMLAQLREQSRLAASRQVREEIVAEPLAEPAKLYKFSELSAMDCELFEIMILNAELAPLALERIAPAQLSSATARALLEVYQAMEMAGMSLEFSHILSAMEDATLKSVLVSLEDHAHRKASVSVMDVRVRLQKLLDRLGESAEDQAHQQQINTLEAQQLPEEEEIALLEEILRQARLRQGLAFNS